MYWRLWRTLVRLSEKCGDVATVNKTPNQKLTAAPLLILLIQFVAYAECSDSHLNIRVISIDWSEPI